MIDIQTDKESKLLVMAIAGLDPSAQAGLVADCIRIAKSDYKPIAICSAFSVQDEHAVRDMTALSASDISKQAGLWANRHLAGIKLGYLHDSQSVAVASLICQAHPEAVKLLDPIIFPSKGSFMRRSENIIAAYIENDFCQANIITPNLQELQLLSGVKDPLEACRKLCKRQDMQIVITSDNLQVEKIVTKIYSPQTDSFIVDISERLAVEMHGSGCAFSTSLLLDLLSGAEISAAVSSSKRKLLEYLSA